MGGGQSLKHEHCEQESQTRMPILGTVLYGSLDLKFSNLLPYILSKPSFNPGSVTNLLVALSTSCQLSVTGATGPQGFWCLSSLKILSWKTLSQANDYKKLMLHYFFLLAKKKQMFLRNWFLCLYYCFPGKKSGVTATGRLYINTFSCHSFLTVTTQQSDYRPKMAQLPPKLPAFTFRTI